MLNEEKVILMTRMAIYEKKQGRKDFKLSKYYRSDYVSLNMINTAIIATFLYVLIIGAIVMINIEKIMAEIVTMDIFGIGKTILIWYLIFVIAYMLVAYIVYSVKYRRAKKKLKKYDDDLRKLYRICKEEQKMSKLGGNIYE